jgi:sortase (surface protein transpeptidase)
MRRLLAAALLVTGVAMVAAVALRGNPPAAEPPAVHVVHPSAAATPQPVARGRRSPPAARPRAAGYSGALSPSAPVELAIPAIGVRASVIPLGENPDGTAQVPSLSTPMLTSWFDDGPAPGQAGPAAIYGHVDTAAAGPAVFYRLGDLVPGARVDVTLADRRVVVFSVYRVAEYAKSAFPTMTVYGDTPGPELRLITCGGTFDASTGSYLDNIVAYARLISVAGT